MPFLAAAAPALLAGAATAGGSALVNGLLQNNSRGGGYQAVGATPEQAQATYDQSQQALAQQRSFLSALQAQGGLQNQSQVYGQLQNVAQGQGPNPAQAMLANATGTNVANQAALMAGQRGAGANVGLIARQAAQQGAQTQQNAVGQAAALQAQQSLNALGQAGSMANQEAAQLQNAQQTYGQQALGEQQNILGAIGNQNAANAGVAINNAKIGGGLAGGALSGLGSAVATSMASPASAPAAQPYQGDAATGRDWYKENAQMKAHGGEIKGGPRSKIGQFFANGGKVPALVSPGEIYLTPEEAREVAKGKVSPAQAGERIPGKAKVKGDSLKNDIVHKNLDEGGVVVPRSKATGKDADKKAAKFVAAVLSRPAKKK